MIRQGCDGATVKSLSSSTPSVQVSSAANNFHILAKIVQIIQSTDIYPGLRHGEAQNKEPQAGWQGSPTDRRRLVSSLDSCYFQIFQNIFVRPQYFGSFYGHNFVTDSNIMKERIEKNCLEKLNNIKLLIFCMMPELNTRFEIESDHAKVIIIMIQIIEL